MVNFLIETVIAAIVVGRAPRYQVVRRIKCDRFEGINNNAGRVRKLKRRGGKKHKINVETNERPKIQ